MIRSVALLAGLLVTPLAVYGQGDPEDPGVVASISAQALSRAMRPILQPDPRDRAKLFAKPAEIGRFAMPAPVFVIAVSPTGCMVAAVSIEQLSQIDGECLRTKGLPDGAALDAMLRPRQLLDRSRMVVLVISPLFDAEAVTRQFGGGVDFEPELAKLRDALAAVRSTLPDAKVVEVTASL